MRKENNTRRKAYEATLRAQHGLINHAQAKCFGLSYRAIHSRVQRREWEKVLPGVFGLCGVPLYEQRRQIAVTLYGEPGCALSGPTAASIWGLEGFEGRDIELSITTHKCTGRVCFSDGREVRVGRVDEHVLENVRTVDGVQVTDLPRTLLDLAGRKHPRTGTALDQALREGLTSLAEMSLFYEKNWLRGRRGVAILRDLLCERLGMIRTESAAEDLLVALLRGGPFPPWEQQHALSLPSGDVRIDFAYPEVKLAIECDSYAWHMDGAAFARDRRRDAELQGLGWRVLRFTWHQLKFEPRYVLGQIQQHLRL